MDCEIINTEYHFFYKITYYKHKIIKNNCFSKYLLIYKFYDNNCKILREISKVNKKNNIEYSKEKYDIDGIMI